MVCEDAPACALCPPGQHSERAYGAARCVPWCAAGKYTVSGTYSPSEQSLGSGAAAAAAAAAVGAGAALAASVAGGSGAEQRAATESLAAAAVKQATKAPVASSFCLRCPAGKFTANTDLSHCVACPTGKFARAAGAVRCANCPAGKHALVARGSTSCAVCFSPALSALLSRGGGGCVACAAGRWFPAGMGARLEHGIGCVVCPAGRHRLGGSACPACPAGTYAAAPGAASCDRCAPGMDQGGDGATACKPCAPGRWWEAWRAPGRRCLACPEGKYAATFGGTSCAKCASGQHAAPAAAPTKCARCRPGRYGGSGASCASCPAGRFQDDGGADRCALCPSGRAQPARAARACAECAAGRRADGLGNVGCRAESGGAGGGGGAASPPSAGDARLRRGEKQNKQAAALAKLLRWNTQEMDFKKKATTTEDSARTKADEKESKSRAVEYAEQTAKKASADSVATERRAKRSPEALGKRDAAMIFKQLAALKKKGGANGAAVGGTMPAITPEQEAAFRAAFDAKKRKKGAGDQWR